MCQFPEEVEGGRANLITKDVGECDDFVHSKQMEIRLYWGVIQGCSVIAVSLSLLVQTFVWLLFNYSVSYAAINLFMVAL